MDNEVKLNEPVIGTEFFKSVAVVVGGSSGIGYHTCLKLIKCGYTVYNLSRSKTAAERVIDIATDVENEGSLESAISDIIAAEKRIDVLVYSAGTSLAAPVEETLDEDMNRLFNINYFGAVKAVKLVLPSMRETGGGKIVLVSSLGGVVPIAFDAHYSASKAALDMFVRALNVEVNRFGIYATSVQPGPTDTRFTFKRKVYDDNEKSPYYKAMRRASFSLAKMEQCGAEPWRVAACIVDTIKKERPPESVTNGFINKAAKTAKKFLPEKVTDFINSLQYE